MAAAAAVATLTVRSRSQCLLAGSAPLPAHVVYRRAAAATPARRTPPRGSRLRALPPELSEILSPKLVPGSPSDTGDVSPLIPVSFKMPCKHRTEHDSADEENDEPEHEEENQPLHDAIENLSRAIDMMPNEDFVTILKKSFSKSILEVGSRMGRSSLNAGGRVEPSNTAVRAADRSTLKTRFNAKGFRQVVADLDERKIKIINENGFGSLLHFASEAIPLSFASWLCQQVDVRTGDIVVGGKRIKLSPQSVYDVLELPIGGRDVLGDPEDGRSLFLSAPEKSVLVSWKTLREKMKNSDLSEDDVLRTFLSIALSTFLCPFSGVKLSPKYLGPLVNVRDAKNWDWCKLVYDWLILHVDKFQRSFRAGSHESTWIGGCIYYLAVVYLDHLDVGQLLTPPATTPRIKVWKGKMISKYANLDFDESTGMFGRRPVKDFQLTCYYRRPDTDQAGPSNKFSQSSKDDLKVLIGNAVHQSFAPDVVNGIADICDKYSRGGGNQEGVVQDAVVEVLKFLSTNFQKKKSSDSSQRGRGDDDNPNAAFENNDNDGPGINPLESDGEDHQQEGGRDPIAGSVTTEILPSSGNVSEPHLLQLGPTQILPSSGIDVGDKNGDLGVRKGLTEKKYTKRKSDRSSSVGRPDEVDSSSQNSVASITRSRQGTPAVADIESCVRVKPKRKKVPTMHIIPVDPPIDDLNDYDGGLNLNDNGEDRAKDASPIADERQNDVNVSKQNDGANKVDKRQNDGAEMADEGIKGKKV